MKLPNRVAYQMRYAHQFEKDGKRVILMATDRPDRFVDAAPGSKRDEQPLSLVKLELDPETGQGKGAMLDTAALTIEDGKLTITTLGTQPTRFTKVTQKKPKKEKKKKS